MKSSCPCSAGCFGTHVVVVVVVVLGPAMRVPTVGFKAVLSFVCALLESERKWRPQRAEGFRSLIELHD